MRELKPSYWVLLIGLALNLEGGVSADEPSIKKIIEHAKKATVKITTYDKFGKSINSGTGFFISADGWVITCFHVVDDAYSARVQFSRRRSVYGIIRKLIVQRSYDYAAFKIPIRNAPYLKISNDNLLVGERVFAISAPLGVADVYTVGTIKRIVFANDLLGIMITPISNNGSSGGPVINTKGEVIGMIASGTVDKDTRIARSTDYTMAVPTGIIKEGLRKYFRRNKTLKASWK